MTAYARENLRQHAYEGFRNNETAYAVSKRLKVRKSTVYRWFNEFEARSENAIKERKRGAEISGHAALSKKERMQLIKDITDKPPEQLKFEFALWSSKAIKDYVHRMFGIEISRRTARRYMKALGFTYQCPVRRAKEQNSKAVAQWLEHTYPSIKTQAEKTKPQLCGLMKRQTWLVLNVGQAFHLVVRLQSYELQTRAKSVVTLSLLLPIMENLSLCFLMIQ